MDLCSLSCNAKLDCAEAVKTLCALPLTETQNQTFGACTTTYVLQDGNNIPTYDQCYSAFASINDAGKQKPDGCGGSFGGALGWDQDEKRTKDPIYAILPKAGNPNCFVTPINEGAKPLGRDILPDGSKLENPDKCPTALSRRINSDLACGIGLGIGVAAGCTAICLSIGFL